MASTLAHIITAIQEEYREDIRQLQAVPMPDTIKATYIEMHQGGLIDALQCIADVLEGELRHDPASDTYRVYDERGSELCVKETARR
jgi:hypothetical protein